MNNISKLRYNYFSPSIKDEGIYKNVLNNILVFLREECEEKSVSAMELVIRYSLWVKENSLKTSKEKVDWLMGESSKKKYGSTLPSKITDLLFKESEMIA